MLSADAIQAEILLLGSKLSLPRNMLMLRTSSSGDGTPYLETCCETYNYVASERGFEIFRKTTDCLDDFLYWYFEGICSILSYEYELNNRIEGQDFRRLAFDKKIELLRILNENWGDRGKVEISEILNRVPFSD